MALLAPRTGEGQIASSQNSGLGPPSTTCSHMCSCRLPKAQCFFMLAIGVAGQIVLHSGSIGEDSMQSWINYRLIGTISLNGILPITTILLCLHTMQMHSWYLLIISMCTILLSIITRSKSERFMYSPKDIARIQATTNTAYPQCGNKDGSRFCLAAGLDRTRSISNLFGGDGHVIFALILLGLLILDHIRFQELLVIQRSYHRFFGLMASWLSPHAYHHRRQIPSLRASEISTAREWLFEASFHWFGLGGAQRSQA